MNSHLVIPDTQVKEGVPLDHLYALANLIRMHTPNVLVHLGDHWDMPSLSRYDNGKPAMENRRYLLSQEMQRWRLSQMLSSQFLITNLRMIFCIGNHEDRITRYANDHPKLENTVTLDDLDLDGWERVITKR